MHLRTNYFFWFEIWNQLEVTRSCWSIKTRRLRWVWDVLLQRECLSVRQGGKTGMHYMDQKLFYLEYSGRWFHLDSPGTPSEERWIQHITDVKKGYKEICIIERFCHGETGVCSFLNPAKQNLGAAVKESMECSRLEKECIEHPSPAVRIQQWHHRTSSSKEQITDLCRNGRQWLEAALWLCGLDEIHVGTSLRNNQTCYSETMLSQSAGAQNWCPNSFRKKLFSFPK